MILTPDDLQELDSALKCLYNNGLEDGDLGLMQRSQQINLIKQMIREIQDE